MSTVEGSVIDIFSGGGALSYGFKREGFQIACGYDVDESCRYAFETNNEAPFAHRDVATLEAGEVSHVFDKNLPRVLIGCAPCQPFSSYSRNREDTKWQLLSDFARLVDGVRPDVVTMENVPRLKVFKKGRVFKRFLRLLKTAGYHTRYGVFHCPDFGVPQRRSRLVLVASRLGEPELPVPTTRECDYSNVRDAIGHLPRLAAGESDPHDPLHKCSQMSELNLERIRASVPGGTWHDWDERLVAACHKAPSGKSFYNVYGRMRWDQPSPTITAQFFAFGHGRYGHPEQDRALSLREGALLQSFPSDYEFIRPGESVIMRHVASQIGNAVPVALAQAIAHAIKKHLKESVR